MTLEHATNRIFDAVSAHAQSDKRCLIAIAGPPAVGKSTLAECLCEKLNRANKQAAIVPMDGFHMDNDTLIANALLHRKGAPMTFDVSAFKSTLESLLRDDEVSVPLFDRAKDCTIPNAAKIMGGDQYVIVEGNYLLLDQEDWRDLIQFWGYSVFVEADFDELERRLINRWLDHGLDHETAKQRAHNNDLINAATVLNYRLKSDLTLTN
jgi:pantothenate kinase